MSEREPTRILDGCMELSGGIDSGRAANLLRRNQMAFLVNGTVRGGFASPRPKYVQHQLDFQTNTSLDAIFNGGTDRFQHLSFYDGNGRASLIVVISGKVYKIDLEDNSYITQDISPAGNSNSPKIKMGWSQQAENYWIYQDGQSAPIIFNGSASRRSDTANKEVPVGTVMGYGMGRLTVALTDRVTFRLGDLIFSSSGTPTNGYVDALLKFTENDFLNEGGDFVARVFGAPSSAGQITAIKNISQLDSSLGQGPQLVFTNNVIFSINAPFDRTTWKDLTSPIQTVAMQDYGAVSQQGTVPTNGDMYYRSIVGVQSLILAVRSFGEPGNTPISSEMDRILKHDTERLLQYESAVNFDNRQLRTCSPVDSERGVYHRALSVIDFHLVSSLSGKLPPVWEGIWTGLNILAVTKGIVNGTERCFAMVLSDANEYQLWEITKQGRFDDEQSRIQWSVELPSYNFQTPTDFKRLFGGDLTLDKIAGTVDVTLSYRTDQELCWHDWDTLQFCAKYRDCADEDVECKDPHTYNELVQVKQKFRLPPDDFNDTMGKLNRVGQEFQPRIDFTGYCRMKTARFFAYPEQESQFTEKRSGE